MQFFPPKHASRCLLNEFSQNYWQESFDGDSFASQSRFGAYVMHPNVNNYHCKGHFINFMFIFGLLLPERTVPKKFRRKLTNDLNE